MSCNISAAALSACSLHPYPRPSLSACVTVHCSLFVSVQVLRCPSAITRALSLQSRGMGGDWSRLMTEEGCSKSKAEAVCPLRMGYLTASASLIMTVTHTARWITMPRWSNCGRDDLYSSYM